MYGVKNIDLVKKNCKSFWKQEFIGRPFLSLDASKDGTVPILNRWTYVRNTEYLKNGDYLTLIREFEEFIKTRAFGGEGLPFFVCDTAPDLFASFFGGEVIGRQGEYTTWVNKIAETASGLNCKFDTDNANYRQLSEYIKFASDYSKDKFLICVPDLHSNMDTLSALLGPENLCLELMLDPGCVYEKLRELNDAYPVIYNGLFNAGDMRRRGSIGWQPIYSPGKSAVVQCDFSCMISPEMARRYVIPSIEREIDFLDNSVYHYDGKGALGHFDDVLSIKKLNCVQWVPGAGEKRTIFWMDLLKRIQKAGKSVWIYDWTKEEILSDKELDPRLTLFSLTLSSETEIEQFISDLEKKYR